MHKFELLQERLRELGWYVEWGLPCCQSCAWSEVPFEHETGPFKGQEVDLSKVLFNHEQDCEDYSIDYDDELDQYVDSEGNAVDEEEYSMVPHLNYTEQNSSMFCFDGGKQGVKNLKEILPIIEECGCQWDWDESGKTRIHIGWEEKE